MSGIDKVPKLHLDNICRIADFAELECLRRADGNVSLLDIAQIIQRDADLDIDSMSDNARELIQQAFNELSLRAEHCGDSRQSYPFSVIDGGELLQFHVVGDNVKVPPIYLYLLLATCLDMQKDKKHGDEDGTVLFELLSREVAACYWGGPSESVDALVFGTGRFDKADSGADPEPNGFRAAVDELCSALGEGHRFECEPSSRVRSQDGKLDIVVWRRFADLRPGKLIGFGQCKTGSNWSSELARLRPEDFCRKWMCRMPPVLPVRMYFIADRVLSDQWHETSVDGGLVFDRCRMVEYSASAPDELVARIERWVRAAASKHKLALT